MDGKNRPAGRDSRLPLITIIQLLFVCYYGNLRSWQRKQLWAVRHTHSAAAYVYVRTSTCGQPDVVLSRSKKSNQSPALTFLSCLVHTWCGPTVITSHGCGTAEDWRWEHGHHKHDFWVLTASVLTQRTGLSLRRWGLIYSHWPESSLFLFSSTSHLSNQVYFPLVVSRWDRWDRCLCAELFIKLDNSTLTTLLLH